MVNRQTGSGVLLAITLCVVVCVPTPGSCCTVFDMSSSGFASSVWHLIPALALFAENGTFFVSLASQSSTVCHVRLAASGLQLPEPLARDRFPGFSDVTR